MLGISLRLRFPTPLRRFIEAFPRDGKNASHHRILFTTNEIDLFTDVCRRAPNHSPVVRRPSYFSKWRRSTSARDLLDIESLLITGERKL